MLHRVALLVASLAASLTLAVALAIAGFGPTAQTVLPSTASTAASTDGADAAAPVQVDKVYVAAPPPQQTVTVHRVVGGGGESEGSEGGD